MRLPPRLREIAARPRAQTFLPLAGYSAFTLLWIGRGVLLHPTTQVLGNADRDKTLILWSFRWWPHAIAHGHDPFVANVVWVPHGVDLAWVTTAPVLSLLLSPLTATVGPVFAYNLAALAAAPLTAWTTFLLARRLTRNVPASLVAGFLFGFSPYVISQSINHLHLAFVCLVPLAGWLAVRFFEGDISRRRYTVLLALVLVLQFGISTEIFATFTLLAVICFVLALLLLDARPQLVALARYSALAYLAAGVVVTPYLVHAFVNSEPTVRRLAYLHTLDLANLIFPTETTWLRPPGSDTVTRDFTSSLPELGGYIGIPLLLVVVLAAATLQGARVRRGLWLLLIAAGAAIAMAAGPEVKLAGRHAGPGIWALLERVPAIGEAIPVRLAMYAVLFVSLIAALWLAQPGPRRWRFGLAGVAVLAFLPTPSGAFWAAGVKDPPFFKTPVYRKYIHPGDVALVFPYASRESWSMYWQAETGFRFSMIGGHTGQAIIPAECHWRDAWESLAGGAPPGGPARFRRFLLAHHVTVIVEGADTEKWSRLLIASSLPDVRSVWVAGVRILRLRPGLPADLPPGGPALPPLGLMTAPGKAVCGHK